MKILCTIFVIASLALVACSDDSKEAEITIQQNGEPARTLRITVEGKKDVVIEDPYIEEIETLSAEYKSQRSKYIREHKSMTPEQRKAFGELRDGTGERVRELQKLRKQYIREQMEKYDGINVVVEAVDRAQASEKTSDYLNSLQKQQ
ncbi:hypothetical protein QEH59_14610 [Coraliomargarita sp. SDUM461004]|uniref:Lipoprotein n=1 Tax=Thalassobacterium sedimentorum TaxID=3041258 RepID=A0ABU1AN96_9BACT|nr:hypothetical protein [Coraliomargarita sp. SDUM461004]MDQ8195663.1 hypothetical protein [Coraliomargarita sp. SDUM461004]